MPIGLWLPYILEKQPHLGGHNKFKNLLVNRNLI